MRSREGKPFTVDLVGHEVRQPSGETNGDFAIQEKAQDADHAVGTLAAEAMKHMHHIDLDTQAGLVTQEQAAHTKAELQRLIEQAKEARATYLAELFGTATQWVQHTYDKYVYGGEAQKTWKGIETDMKKVLDQYTSMEKKYVKQHPDVLSYESIENIDISDAYINTILKIAQSYNAYTAKYGKQDKEYTVNKFQQKIIGIIRNALKHNKLDRALSLWHVLADTKKNAVTSKKDIGHTIIRYIQETKKDADPSEQDSYIRTSLQAEQDLLALYVISTKRTQQDQQETIELFEQTNNHGISKEILAEFSIDILKQYKRGTAEYTGAAQALFDAYLEYHPEHIANNMHVFAHHANELATDKRIRFIQQSILHDSNPIQVLGNIISCIQLSPQEYNWCKQYYEQEMYGSKEKTFEEFINTYCLLGKEVNGVSTQSTTHVSETQNTKLETLSPYAQQNRRYTDLAILRYNPKQFAETQLQLKQELIQSIVTTIATHGIGIDEITQLEQEDIQEVVVKYSEQKNTTIEKDIQLYLHTQIYLDKTINDRLFQKIIHHEQLSEQHIRQLLYMLLNGKISFQEHQLKQLIDKDTEKDDIYTLQEKLAHPEVYYYNEQVLEYISTYFLKDQIFQHRDIESIIRFFRIFKNDYSIEFSNENEEYFIHSINAISNIDTLDRCFAQLQYVSFISEEKKREIFILIVKKMKNISIDTLGMLCQKNEKIWNVAVNMFKEDEKFWNSIIQHRVSFLFNYNIKQLSEEIQAHICTQDNMHHIITQFDQTNSMKLLYFIEKNNIQIREKDRQYLLSIIILHIPKNKNIVETIIKKLKIVAHYDANKNNDVNLSSTDIQKNVLHIIKNIPKTYTQNENFSLQLLKAYLEDPTYVSECVACIQQLLQIEQQSQESIQNVSRENTTDIQKMQGITLQEVIIDLFITIDPTVGELFNNPQKLGKIKESIIKNIISYVQELVQQGVDFALLKKEVSTKLQNIKRIFESSNTPDSKKRALFLDQFDLSTCKCPQVAPYVSDAQKMKEIAINDVVDILTQSGSKKEHVPEEKTREAQEYKKRRSEENKQVIRSISKGEKNNIALLPDNALTHGSRSEYLGLMLSQGNFSGELLGVSGKSDSSGALGVDLSKVDNNEITFEKRYKKLSNGQYGDIVFVYGQYDNKERPAYHSGVIGGDHYLVRSGISSVEITTIIIRDNTQGDTLTKVKKEIAANGMFIPVVDTNGNILFTEQEYDDMKAVYETMHRKGYDFSLIDTVYDFYIHKKGNEKQQIVLSRIIEELKQGNDVSIDLVILVSFFQGNDLNMKPIEWYQTKPIHEVISLIKQVSRNKKRKKIGEDLSLGAVNLEEKRGLVESIEEIEKLGAEAKKQTDMKNFFDVQLPLLKSTQEEKHQYEKAIGSIIFGREQKNIQHAAELLSEQKKRIMQLLWNTIWEHQLQQASTEEQKKNIRILREKIVPVISGSIARQEAVLQSDFDYLLLVDDSEHELTQEEHEYISTYIINTIVPAIQQTLDDYGIKSDAGLARSEKTPFTTVRNMKKFSIHLHHDRQEEEPTQMMDAVPLFDTQSDREVVTKAKTQLYENEDLPLFTSYIAKDLELTKGSHASYIQQFETVYNSFSEKGALERIKHAMQRVITFKMYHLLFQQYNDQRISKEELVNVPASTIGKITFLYEKGVLSKEEMTVCATLHTLAYRLRFASEVLSIHSDNKPGSFRTEYFSYEEREQLFTLMTKFKQDIVYK